MGPRIAVGLESTLDILIAFPELDSFEEFAYSYDGELSSKVKRGYETVAKGSGGEVPIDGKRDEAQELLKMAEGMEAEISYSFGGNGPLEVATLENLGSETHFLGGIFPQSFSKIPRDDKISLRKTNMTLSQVFNEYSPASYVYQAEGTNRYIHAEGEGRRITQLRSYLKNLPDIVQSVSDMYGELDALSIPDWHVVFGNSLDKEDFQLVNHVIREIREVTDATLFTDAGGIDELGRKERERLCRIYSLFDVLSVNEDEVHQVTESIGNAQDNEVESMNEILERGDFLSTIWIHTLYYQMSLSTRFNRDLLDEAQKNAALSGLYRVETGGFPTMEDIQTLEGERDYFERGIEKKKAVEEEYGEGIDGRNLVVTPCFDEENFVSSVGAGDVSLAAYMYSLVS